ncbi:PTS sugar transporter subunit IIA [Enterococcus hulanensis]|uniref:PTS sugar transporter subunit IIA n=1 Tax=Enterococcus hulanensis TaxID=2559929 RepID=A0ABU3EUU9_9ENTE|nr:MULTISPECIES: PTS sugar transporter subunit IIA [Enterococcus]MBO0457640.1 PTS sugar transporter subunit IIA [Enterococcus hulanensis]MBX8935377.1 PTS sugar transporter subunit IIA [Enterococcus gilvus]MDT2598644.1 PTS sugar transporter subunit IIA [Enterococcus hulanensis]MDT2607851.1 PTS sugar transporter subunit IIA [Enterococcus hulanensis]MDT2615146.1 PTS sugar transporter subunit IIA [Enterococcus hulanensis]
METNMSNVLVMTHGEFAAGIKKSAEMIIGKQDNFETLVFTPEMSLDTLVSALKETLRKFDNDYPTLVFVDLFGGSPSNAVALLLAEGYDVQAISGVNLPMLLEVLGGRTIFPLENLVSQGITAGSEGVINIVKKFTEE